MREGGTLDLLVGETIAALTAPRRFARSLTDERHGLSSILVTLAAAFVFGAAVDLMAVASTAGGVPPGTVIVDAALFAGRIAVFVAVGATLARIAARALGRDVRIAVVLAAVGMATAPLLLAPLALVPALIGLWLAALAVGVVLVLWSAALTVLNLRSVIGRRALIGAALAVPVLLYGLSDRVITAGVFSLTMQPSPVSELPAQPAGGETFELSAGISVTLPSGWSRVSTSVDIAQFGRDIDVLRVTRLQPRELDTVLTGADATLARETRGVDVRSAERRLWRDGADLVVEDVRSGIYSGRPITHVLYSRVMPEGHIGLLFHYVGEVDPAGLLERYRPIALTLRSTARP